MVSLYHHCFFVNDVQNAGLVRVMRRRLPFADYGDVRSNLPRFIESALMDGSLLSRFTWVDFVRAWADRADLPQTRYEDLRSRPTAELRRLCSAVVGSEITEEFAQAVVEEFSFARQSGRRPGEENKSSFIRRGVVG